MGFNRLRLSLNDADHLEQSGLQGARPRVGREAEEDFKQAMSIAWMVGKATSPARWGGQECPRVPGGGSSGQGGE